MVGLSRIFGICVLLHLAHQTFSQLLNICGRQVYVQPGQDCWKIANENHILVDYLRNLNPGLDCDELQPNEALCVAPAECQICITVRDQDCCSSILSMNGITPPELQLLNPQGVDCNSLYVGQMICVSRSHETKSATSTEPTPEPTSSSTTSKKAIFKRGDTCWVISSANDITLSELEEFNKDECDHKDEDMEEDDDGRFDDKW